MSVLPIPSFFDAASVGRVWRVPYAERAREADAWARRFRLRPSATDERRVSLVLVDCQNTFCIPGFELFVGGRSGTGAVEDNKRLCEFVYRNLHRITEISATLDTHTSLQIFHPAFWVDEGGQHPEGGATVITEEDVERGRWRVNPLVADSIPNRDGQWVERYALHYVRSLARGRYPLMVWPYHAMLGGIGHALVPAVEEALFFHGIARMTSTRFEIKGNNSLTENYSALSPEVLKGPAEEPVATSNQALVDRLLRFDAVIIAGQAKSHCVAWTVHDLLEEIRKRDPGLAGKVFLLEDCCSPVVVPGVVDFTDHADEAFDRFSEAGMNLVHSSADIEEWA